MANTATASADSVDKSGGFFVEQLKAESGLYDGYTERPYNPDVVAKIKTPFGVYDEMRMDDQVKAVLWMKKFMVLSTGWEIESRGNEAVRDELNDNLSMLDNPDFSDALINILSHLEYGFSITEPVFDIDESTGTPKVRLKKLKTRAPHAFTLHTDEYGNFIEIEQDNMGDDVRISPDKVIWMVHQYEFGVPYGKSDLQAAYRAWFSKKIIIKFWNIYLERFGNPLIVGTFPNTMSQADKNKLLDILKNLQAKTGIVVPEGVSLEIKTSQTGTTDFERAIDKHNMMIARSMLVPDLVGISGSGTSGGSFALGEKHFDMFFLTVEKLRKDLERMVNRHIIRPLVFWNYGLTGTDVPIWKLNPVQLDEKLEFIKAWSEAVKGKIWVPTDEEINHFRETIKFPTGDVERPEPPQAPPPFGGEPTPFKKHAKRSRSLTKFEKKVDFNKIESDFDRIEETSAKELVPVFRRIKEGLVDTVTTKRLVEKKKFDAVDGLKLKFLKDLQLGFKTILRETHEAGKASARSELSRARRVTEFVDDPTAMELFEAALEKRSFFITGVESAFILNNAKQIILNGIEKGLTNREVIFRLSELFSDNYEFGKNRIETITRTNITKSFNQARRGVFEDPALENFVTGYQYSAILDSRTTDICVALDGKVYKSDDPYIDQITPPLHYQCRSTLVPISELEEFEPDSRAVSEDDLRGFAGNVS